MICRRRFPSPKSFLAIAYFLAVATLPRINPAAQVIATRLDGTTAIGELREWTTDGLRVATSAGDQAIRTNQLISLRWQPAGQAAATANKPLGLVELIDGALLPIQAVEIKKSQATLNLAIPGTPSDQKLSLAIEQIASVRLRPLDPPLAKQWDEILHMNLANDVLAVIKKDGKSIDYVEGVVGNVASDKIEFKLDGEWQRVDRAKIAGIVYYRPDRRLKNEPRATLHGRSGLRVSATRFELKDSQVELTTAVGAKLSWPVGDLSVADFSAGKLLYLSDIEPASENWVPLVALPAGLNAATQYGLPRRDQSAFGGPLTLTMREGDTASAQAASRSFAKGLAIRSRTEMVYRLPAGFQRFVATAGIDPAASTNGKVRLSIQGDDRVLLDTEIAGDEPPHPIQLDIGNVKRLKLVVDYGQNLDTGDWLNLCDARIVK